MKGVAFTMDAVFAIMIAAIAISILLYFHYAPINQYTIKFSSLNSLVTLLSSTTLGNFTATPLASQMNAQYNARYQTWPVLYQDSGNNASNAGGPSTASLSVIDTAYSNINPNSLISGNGEIYFVDYYSSSIVPYFLEKMAYYSYGYVSAATGSGPFPTNKSMTNITADILYNNNLVYTNKTSLVYANVWANNNAIPSSGDVSSQLLPYDNVILVPMYVSSNSAETGIMGFYVSNGTKAWTINTGGEVSSIAIVSGSIAAEVGNTVELFAYTNQGSPTSLYNTTYNYGITGIMSYNGSAYVANSATYSGISSYNGTIYYQSVTDYTSAKGNVNSGSWTTYMPSYVGTSLTNGQPVVSQDNLYTLWSNRYLVDQNPYTGAIKWAVHIPYTGTLSPHMMLAYGKLFVISGDLLLGFGTCLGHSNQSLMSNIASLYLDLQSSCADSLLNAANPAENASVIVNRTGSDGLASFIKGTYKYPYVLNFTGSSGYISIGNNSALSPEAGSSGKMSLCTWYRINSLSNYYGPLIKGESPPSSGNAWEYTFDQEGYGASNNPSFTVWSPSGSDIAHGSANTITFNSMVHNWSFTCFTYDYAGQQAYYYFNGVQYPANITTSHGPAGAGSGSFTIGAGENPSNPTGTAGYSNVSVADVQMYNTVLSPGQIKAMYDQGITASPIQSNGLVGWWPLGGDANDYSGNGYVGFPFNAKLTYSNFISPAYLNAYDVGVFKTVVPVEGTVIALYYMDTFGIFGDNSQLQGLINAGVYSWK